MPDKYTDLVKDPDHKGYVKAKPSDLGKGQAKLAGNALANRKKQIDDATQ